MTLEAQAAAHLATLRVLYVEDDADTREAVGVFLARRVGTLVTAAGGRAGLEAFRAEPARIVVTDIQMPDLDGLAMARSIRDLEPGVPILVTTAFEQPDYMMRAIDLGVDGYIVKPIQGERLEAALLACARRLLAETQLRRQQRLEAQELKQRHQNAIATLLRGVAHDYNNLLQSILSAVSLAKASLDPEHEARRILELIDRSSAQARTLSRRLAALASPSERLDQVAPLEPLLRRTLEEALPGPAFGLDFDFQGRLPVRHGRADLGEVLAGLAANAREAMPDGGAVRVATRAVALGDGNRWGLPVGSYLAASIQDSGAGIEPGNLPLVFEPYFSTKERGTQRGMGLGLALCEAVLRAHGGAVSVESTPGEGATFTLLLPAAPAGGA
jgi:signal transduction histidine kinase